jgi:hypothetical protein
MFCYYKPEDYKKFFFSGGPSKSFDHGSRLFPQDLPHGLVSDWQNSEGKGSSVC